MVVVNIHLLVLQTHIAQINQVIATAEACIKLHSCQLFKIGKDHTH
jgi:hypothetical protein